MNPKQYSDGITDAQLTIAKMNDDGYETVFIGGYFQILHANHLMYFRACKERIAKKTGRSVDDIFLIVGLNNDSMAKNKYKKRGVGEIDFIPAELRKFQLDEIKSVGDSFILPEDELHSIKYGSTSIESEIYAVKLGVKHIVIPEQSIDDLEKEKKDLHDFFKSHNINLELLDIDSYRVFYLQNKVRVSTTNIIELILKKFIK